MPREISKITLFTHHISLVKIHRHENRSLTVIHNGECWHLFSIWQSLGLPRTTFQRYQAGLIAFFKLQLYRNRKKRKPRFLLQSTALYLLKQLSLVVSDVTGHCFAQRALSVYCLSLRQRFSYN